MHPGAVCEMGKIFAIRQVVVVVVVVVVVWDELGYFVLC